MKKFTIPPKHLLNKSHMLSWQSWIEGNNEHFYEIRYFKAPMWLYYFLHKCNKFIPWLLQKLTYEWQTDFDYTEQSKKEKK